jgi:F-box-like
MSISSISQSNVLGEDVLQMIFQHLDAGDLLKCEAVCRQWRDIFLAGTPWRRLYHRNIGRLRPWRKAQKELELDQKTLRTEQYRGICKDILQKVDRY